MSLVYEKMKEELLHKIAGITLELVDIIPKEKSKEAADGTTTAEPYLEIHVEIPRGNGNFSRCRFSVKVPGGVIQIAHEVIEEKMLYVSFSGLTITFIDPNRKEVYFKAEAYEIEEA